MVNVQNVIQMKNSIVKHVQVLSLNAPHVKMVFIYQAQTVFHVAKTATAKNAQKKVFARAALKDIILKQEIQSAFKIYHIAKR